MDRLLSKMVARGIKRTSAHRPRSTALDLDSTNQTNHSNVDLGLNLLRLGQIFELKPYDFLDLSLFRVPVSL